MRTVRSEFLPRFADAWSVLEDRFGKRRWLVVADRRVVAKNPDVFRGLGRRRRAAVLELSGGEAIKRLGTLDRLTAAANATGLGRDGLVVALGGGTIGDVAGFFASVFQRGVDWVPVATTTLSMADSAVGGKTAVDWRGLKNQLGTFHGPAAVLAVEESLRTLPRRHVRAGLAEVVKSAVIADAGLFDRLEQARDELARVGSGEMRAALRDAAEIKATIVTRDPREAGVRIWLNFGHTVGHALEAIHRPRLLHGEAIAMGMIAASWISERLVGAPSGTTDRVEELLRRIGTLRVLAPVDDRALREAMASDKKARNGRARLVLTPRIGLATVADQVPAAMVRQAIRQMQRRCGSSARGNPR